MVRITDQERVDFNLTADCVLQHEIEDVAKLMVLAPTRVMCQNELGTVTSFDAVGKTHACSHHKCNVRGKCEIAGAKLTAKLNRKMHEPRKEQNKTASDQNNHEQKTQ